MEQAGDECLDGIAGHLFHDAQNHGSRTQNEGINGKDAEFVALDEVTDQTDGQKAEDQCRRHTEQRRAPFDAHAAGRCVMQDDVRLDAAVKDGSFKKNPIFLQAIEHAKKNGTALHLLAYLTYKSSHGCIDYPISVCEMAKEAGLDKVYFHIIFDGRSTEPGSAPTLLAELDAKLDEIGLGRIVDGVGRGVVLDRDKNYDKVKRAYDAMVEGVGTQYE